ncbi:uncharacterized protein LOC100890939 [Strongylocentrotus purpuratus]|uniref:Uncharacterized protein n=1 Tax=Strongylocentrotus purpuratus TaxID=7668 RepID=A0A7M7GPF5_STRPU|nr:uncharacterized protein LOC100890939 [Strongylocentrotus purpuratus]
MLKLRQLVLRICLLMAMSGLIHAELNGFRLVGGKKPNQGRLQVRFDHSSSYQYMCGDAWTVQNSKVVCRQLGYPGLVRDYRTTSEVSFVTSSDGDTVSNVASVRCQGSEYDLASCPSNHSVVSCSIDQTVSIVCHDFGYLGCFRQRPHEIGLVPNAVRFNYDITNNDECIERCSAGYDYAGSSGPLCICTFKHPSVELDPSTDEECSERCGSNSLQACGRSTETRQQAFYTFYSTREGLCNAASAPANGNVTGTFNRYGDIVTFRCNAGYDLIGMDSLQCLVTSENSSEIFWNGMPPICFASNSVPSLVPTSSTQSTMVWPPSTTPSTQATSQALSSSNPTLTGSSRTTLPGSITTEGSNNERLLDVKFIALLSGLTIMSVCFIILVVVFVCCFVLRRNKRSSGEVELELQPMQCPSPLSHPDCHLRGAVKNDYVSGTEKGNVGDVTALDDHDSQVHHNYCSFRQEPNAATNLGRTDKRGSTELLVDDEGVDNEYACTYECAYECIDVDKTDAKRMSDTSMILARSVAAKETHSTHRSMGQLHEGDVGPMRPTSMKDHEYTYIANAHTPPFLSENRNTAYETPMDPSSAHVFQEVNRPLGQELHQDTSHYLNKNVIHPRSRANRDMNHN